MADNNLNEEVMRLRSQIAALEQLLEVHEMTVLEQSDRLEQAITLQSKRAAELQTVAQVSGVAASLLETSELLQAVVDLTKSSFELYHAHIYLLDESGKYLELVTGAGEVGKQMVGEAWQIALDAEQSFVAQVARERQGVIVNDVHATPGFMANPLLPDTASEMAVPLVVGDDVLGVLDVQSVEINHFSEEDIIIMTTLGSQVAVALQNARQFQQTQMALGRTDELYGISQAINEADTNADLLEALARPVAEHGAARAQLMYVDLDEAGKPEWTEIVAYWDATGAESHTPIGSRFYIPEFPFFQLFMADPENPSLISNTQTDERVDRATRSIMEQSNDQAVVVIPLTRGKEQIGVLSFSWDQPHKFSAQEAEIYRAIIDLASPAAQSRHLFEQTQAALDAVQESQAALAETLDIARMANWTLDLTTATYTFNDQLYNLLQTTAEEVGGYEMSAEQYLQDYVHPEDVPHVMAEIQRALQITDADYLGNVQFRTIIGAGEIRYMDVQYRLEMNEEGQAVRAYGSYLDITERRQAEENLRQVSELQTAILKGAVYGIISTTPEGIITTFNPGAEEMLGYKAEEVVNQADPGAFHDLDEVIARAQEFSEDLGIEIEPGFEVFVAKARQNLPNEYEWTYIRKDGTRFPVLLSVTALRDTDGEITGFLGIANDITDRKHAEETITKRAAELATVADVGTRVSTILDQQELIETVVQLTRERFKLYHCHIFLIDESTQTLQVAACGWEVDSPHVGVVEQVSIPADQEQSLVARAVREQRAIIVNDVQADPNWLPNELLPETRAEMAVPLIAGNQVLGVLDVQADQTGHFTDEDISIMSTLGSQVAIAIQNANQFRRTQATLDDLTRLQRNMSREGWQAFMTATERSLDGYLVNKGGARPLMEDNKRAGIDDGRDAETVMTSVAEIKTDEAVVITPMNIRGVTIGGLGVRVPPGEEISPEDQEMLNSVSEQVALALETARLFEQGQITLAETETLYTASDRIGRATNMNDVLTALIELTLLQNFERASLNIFDHPWDPDNPPKGMTMVTSWIGSEDATEVPEGTYYRLDEYPAARFLALNEPTFIPNLATDPRFDENSRQYFTEVLKVKAVVGLPLVIAGRSIGGIVVQSGEVENISEDDIRQISTLTDQAATVIQNMRLFEQTQFRAQREQALRQITAAVRGSTDPTTIMRTAVRELGAALGRRTQIRFAQFGESVDEDNGNS